MEDSNVFIPAYSRFVIESRTYANTGQSYYMTNARVSSQVSSRLRWASAHPCINNARSLIYTTLGTGIAGRSSVYTLIFSRSFTLSVYRDLTFSSSSTGLARGPKITRRFRHSLKSTAVTPLLSREVGCERSETR